VPFPALPCPEQQVTGERDHDQLPGHPLRHTQAHSACLRSTAMSRPASSSLL
jgi:hypothetical protein